jgi:hypothetical protein
MSAAKDKDLGTRTLALAPVSQKAEHEERLRRLREGRGLVISGRNA